MNTFGALSVFKFRHMLTPIAIDWVSHAYINGHSAIAFKSLYVFGVRIMRWRTDV